MPQKIAKRIKANAIFVLSFVACLFVTLDSNGDEPLQWVDLPTVPNKETQAKETQGRITGVRPFRDGLDAANPPVATLQRPETTAGVERSISREDAFDSTSIPTVPPLDLSQPAVENLSLVQLGKPSAQLPQEKPQKPIPIPSVLAGNESRPISLMTAIHTSIASQRIFNSFEGVVVIEKLSTYDEAIAAQRISVELARFDPSVASTLLGSHIDRPPDSFFGPGIQQDNRRDELEFNARLNKIWPTGLSTTLAYEPSLAYLFFPKGTDSAFNPSHSSDLTLRATQPLLRGRGTGVNLASLRIAGHRVAQSQMLVESAIQSQLRSIEQVYWLLHAAHVRMKAVDDAIEAAQKTVSVAQLRYEGERALYSEVARATVGLEQLYQQKLDSELNVQKTTLDLAQLIGLDLNKAMILVPNDRPEFEFPHGDSAIAIADALRNNPSLRSKREELAVLQNTLIAAGNQQLPQFDVLALHRTSGLENDLGDSLREMMKFEFNDFALGVQLTQQLGAREGKSKAQISRLQLAREVAVLSANERQVAFQLTQDFNDLIQTHARYQSALRQFAETQRWVEIARSSFEDPPIKVGGRESLLLSLLDYQTAIQAKVNAVVLVAEALAEYNGRLSVIDERRGMMLARWGVSLNHGELPLPPKLGSNVPVGLRN